MNAHQRRNWLYVFFSGLFLMSVACEAPANRKMEAFKEFTLDYDTPVEPALQREVEVIDAAARGRLGLTADQTEVGVMDLRDGRLAMIHPDREEYAASVPKVGILLAYFHLQPEAASNLSSEVCHELGLMVKASSNEAAERFSQMLGLKEIQRVMNEYGFYDVKRGGGIWVGKHYGVRGERYGSPVADNSHAATVRQLLRFYLMLEQGKLVSAEGSRSMRQIFESPELPHDHIKFVKGLAEENVQIIRKWGSWEDWLHDSAVVKGDGRHYILVGLTRHPRGDEYLEEIAKAVHGLM